MRACHAETAVLLFDFDAKAIDVVAADEIPFRWQSETLEFVSLLKRYLNRCRRRTLVRPKSQILRFRRLRPVTAVPFGCDVGASCLTASGSVSLQSAHHPTSVRGRPSGQNDMLRLWCGYLLITSATRRSMSVTSQSNIRWYLLAFLNIPP